MVSDSPYRVRERRETLKRGRVEMPSICFVLVLDMSRRKGNLSKVPVVYILAALSPERASASTALLRESERLRVGIFDFMGLL